MSDESRFNRIEKKLDGITQILAIQAAHDERITALAAREHRSEKRLDEIEKQVLHNSTVARVLTWFAASLTGAVILYAIKMISENG